VVDYKIKKTRMKTKIALTFGAFATALAMLPMFAAFEAHVINVTARIENALEVPIEHLDFGTVFPQEWLGKPLAIRLSQSFIDEGRVDDVDYFIRQKPKCGVTTLDGQTLVVGSTQTGHVMVGDNPDTPNITEDWWVDCGEAPVNFDSSTHMYGVLPMLCPYISKHPDNQPENDDSLDSFHKPFVIRDDGTIVWNDTRGHLAKSQQDIEDNWIIDLAVPCFGGHCAQDWKSWVASVNPTADASQFVQDIKNEHKVFGCDLWVEVSGISLPGLGCREQADIMLVVDRSGSVGSDEATLKNAAKAFVDALGLNGVHAGLASFATGASLNEHLGNNAATLKAAIDALVIGGTTYLQGGIETATAELANPGDGHDRADATSPDFMVIITDGVPNICTPAGCNPEDAAADAADAARAAGIEVYVVGVGNQLDEDYLKMEIADDAAHYFSAADFGALEDILEDLAQCNQ
jgi:hypothetical protein